jgi:DNA-binding transcriptional MerR regulator
LLIGDFSKISRLGIKTLRYYHEIGLLEPGRVDAFTGYRYYDEECLSRVRAISRLKDLNFSLGEIRDILAGKQKDMSILQLLRKKLAEVEGQLAVMEKSRDQLAAFVNTESLPLLRPGPVAEKRVPDQAIASIRFRGRYPEVGNVLSGLVAACGALASGAPFSLYHDDQPMEDGADIEVCVPLSVSLADLPASGGEGRRERLDRKRFSRK